MISNLIISDVSWGTKGDNAAAALGGVTAVKSKDGQDTVEVEMITELKDINNNYEKFIRNLAEARPSDKSKRDAKTKMEDYFKNFRTRIVLMWLFSNGLVVVSLSNPAILTAISQPFLISPNGSSNNAFLSFIFWSVAGLSLVRFIGSTTYLILRMIRG